MNSVEISKPKKKKSKRKHNDFGVRELVSESVTNKYLDISPRASEIARLRQKKEMELIAYARMNKSTVENVQLKKPVP